jgi:hypothetical protein
LAAIHRILIPGFLGCYRAAEFVELTVPLSDMQVGRDAMLLLEGSKAMLLLECSKRASVTCICTWFL